MDVIKEAPWKRIALFLITLAVLIACGLILSPFLSAIVGAIVLAVITQRPFNWLLRRVKSPSLAATLAIILLVLSVFIPTYFIGQHLGQQAIALAAILRSDTTQQHLADYFNQHSSLANTLQSFTNGIDIQHAARTTVAYLGVKLATLLGHSISAITQIVILLFLLFFLYRDEDEAIAFCRSLIPLRPHETDQLLESVSNTIYATALGRLAVAGVQGILAGLAYWALGIPNWLFWALLTAIVALIPAFGTVLVWGPIALYLGFSGHWGHAALLAVWGGLVVSTIDNFLYPILVGTQIRQHTAIILLSILGGVVIFGLSGLILGPVLFAVANTLLEFWRSRTAATPYPDETNPDKARPQTP